MHFGEIVWVSHISGACFIVECYTQIYSLDVDMDRFECMKRDNNVVARPYTAHPEVTA